MRFAQISMYLPEQFRLGYLDTQVYPAPNRQHSVVLLINKPSNNRLASHSEDLSSYAFVGKYFS
jgi:hypothetical protein